LEERRRLSVCAKAAQWSLLVVIVLGLGGRHICGAAVLRGIAAMTGTAIAYGGRHRGRLPVGRQRRRARLVWRAISNACWSGRGDDGGLKDVFRHHSPMT